MITLQQATTVIIITFINLAISPQMLMHRRCTSAMSSECCQSCTVGMVEGLTGCIFSFRCLQRRHRHHRQKTTCSCCQFPQRLWRCLPQLHAAAS